MCRASGGCNVSKRDRDPVAWLTERLGESKSRTKLVEIETYFASIQTEEKSV